MMRQWRCNGIAYKYLQFGVAVSDRFEWIDIFLWFFSFVVTNSNAIDWSPLGYECANPVLLWPWQKDSIVILQIDSEHWPLSFDTMAFIESAGKKCSTKKWHNRRDALPPATQMKNTNGKKQNTHHYHTTHTKRTKNGIEIKCQWRRTVLFSFSSASSGKNKSSVSPPHIFCCFFFFRFHSHSEISAHNNTFVHRTTHTFKIIMQTEKLHALFTEFIICIFCFFCILFALRFVVHLLVG